MEKMKKLIIALIISITIVGGIVIAQEKLRPRIKTIATLGKGIAISQTDPKDFKLVKAGIATVRLSLAGEGTELRVGILFLDNERYKLKNITISDGSVSGNVYLNETQVGSFEASSVMKGNLEVWVGTLTINEETWNIYVLEAPRKIKPIELGWKIADLCGTRPDRCKRLIKGIGPSYCEITPENSSCREKIKNWCEEYPTDQRCIALLRNYCRFHINDSRCRKTLREFCMNNTENEKCRFFELKVTEKFCEKYPLDKKCIELEKKRIVEYCISHPDEEKCIKFENAKEFRERVKLARFCKENPTEEKCEDFCESHPIACQTPPTITPNVTVVSIETIMKTVPAGSMGPLPLR